jgi:ribosome recycling factor
MHSLVLSRRDEFNNAKDHFKQELSLLRTGRATPNMVEDILVEAYGSMMALKGLGNINSTDPKTIVVDPWDKSLMKNIEKALTDARLGTNPVIDGMIIRLSFPAMTEETRKQVVKMLKQKEEAARIEIRRIREASREEISKKEQAHEISEDERFSAQAELEEITKTANEELKKMTDEKETEIMTI